MKLFEINIYKKLEIQNGSYVIVCEKASLFSIFNYLDSDCCIGIGPFTINPF